MELHFRNEFLRSVDLFAISRLIDPGLIRAEHLAIGARLHGRIPDGRLHTTETETETDNITLSPIDGIP